MNKVWRACINRTYDWWILYEYIDIGNPAHLGILRRAVITLDEIQALGECLLQLLGVC